MDAFQVIQVLLVGLLISASLASDSLLPKPSVIYTSQHNALIKWPDIDTKTDYYTVEYGKDFDHSRTFQISKKTNTAMIHGLKPDTSYRVRVKAPNVHPGPSIRFRTKPYAVSFGAPVVAVEPRPYNKLLVTWNLPSGMHPSDVVHFSLIYSPLYSPFFMKTSLVLPGHYRKFTLKFLRPGTVYKVKIAALLKTRKGPYSAWAMEKTGSLGITGPAPKTTPVHYTQWTMKTTASTLDGTTTMPSKTTHRQTTVQVTTQQQLIKSQADQTTTHESPQPTQQHTLPQTTEQSTTAKTTKSQTSQQTSPRTFEQTTTSPMTNQTTTHTDKTSLQTTDQAITSQTTKLFTTSQPTHQTQNTHQTTLPQTTHEILSKTTNQQQTTKQPLQETSPSTQMNNHTTKYPGITEDSSQTSTSERPVKHTTSPKELAPPKTRPKIKELESTTSPVSMETPGPTRDEPEGRCERIITGSICSDNGYETTKVVFKKNQQQMMKHVESVWSLMSSVCKDEVNLKRFLCAVNFPYCSVLIDLPILPCRSMCMITRNSCILESDDIWPAELDCNNFPKDGETTCVSFGHNGDKAELSTVSSILSSVITSTKTDMKIITRTGKPESSMIPIPVIPGTATSQERATTEKTIDDNNTAAINTQNVQTETEPSTENDAIITEEISSEPSTVKTTVISDISTTEPLTENAAIITEEISSKPSTVKTTVISDISTTEPSTENAAIITEEMSTKPSMVKTTVISDISTTEPSTENAAIMTEEISSEPSTVKTTVISDISTTEPSNENAAIITEEMSTKPSTMKTTVISDISTSEPSTENVPIITEVISTDPSTKKSILITEKASAGATTDEKMTRTEIITTVPTEKIFEAPTEEAITKTTTKDGATLYTAASTVPPATGTLAVPQTTLQTTSLSLKKSPNQTSTKYSPTPTAAPFPTLHSTQSLSKTGTPSPGLRSPLSGRCEKLKLTMCNGVGYKWIQFPNYFNQTHQNDVARSIVHYWPVVEVQCSKYFTHFLCSFYTPVCTDLLPSDKGTINGNILPCRSLCEKVDRECGPLMRTYKYTWPEGIDCRKLPEDGKETCFYPNSDLVKFAKPTPKPVQSTDVNLGSSGCQELSSGHVCKNHYITAALSNMSKSFQTVSTAIKYRIALFKDRAGRKCLRNLELFMCSIYAPRCSSDYQPLGPCRSQCKTTVRRCNFILKDLIALLPELDNCRQFPLTGCTANRHRSGKLSTKRKSSIETYN